jgi:hypothetical protein
MQSDYVGVRLLSDDEIHAVSGGVTALGLLVGGTWLAGVGFGLYAVWSTLCGMFN